MKVTSHRFSPTTVMFLLTLVVPLHSQQPADWKDPSSHIRRFVTVSDNVRLGTFTCHTRPMSSARYAHFLAGCGSRRRVFGQDAA